ncbi:hypothetical protein C8R45DRAFT_942757 [Mycena sanguinolenta]|nr:hypothetical protein C8R45DRAFT_942757 [Mycena sanguinolenta]
MLPSYFSLFLLFASLSDAQLLFSSNFQGDWVNGNETALPDVETCGNVTQTPGSSVNYEPEGVDLFLVYGRLPPDPTIAVELDGETIAPTPNTTANPAGCHNLLYKITLSRALHNLTFTFIGPVSNNNFFALDVGHVAAPSTTAPANSSIAANATGTNSASVIPSSTNSALPVADTQPQSSHSATRARLGGAIGSTISIVAIFAAVGAHLGLKAPVPGASLDYEFEFLPLGAPITFRGKRLKSVQITILLKVANLAVTDKKPGALSTDELTSSRHDVQVAWKVITLCEGKLVWTRCLLTYCFISVGKEPTSVRLPKDANFSLGFGGVNDCTYHAKPSPSFSPFLVVPEVQYRDGQLCVAPQCEDLRITAYITENIQERQLLYDRFYESEPSRPIVSPDDPHPAEEEEESDLAPQPIDTEEYTDEIHKILSPALLGESGKLLSNLQQLPSAFTFSVFNVSSMPLTCPPPARTVATGPSPGLASVLTSAAVGSTRPKATCDGLEIGEPVCKSKNS